MSISTKLPSSTRAGPSFREQPADDERFRVSPMASSTRSFTRKPWRRAKISVVIDRAADRAAASGTPAAPADAGRPRTPRGRTRGTRGRAGCRRRARARPRPAPRPARASASPSMTALTSPNSRSQPSGVKPVFVDPARAHDLERRAPAIVSSASAEPAHRAVVGEPDREHDRDAERDAGHRERRAELLLARRRRMNCLKSGTGVCRRRAGGPRCEARRPSRRCTTRRAAAARSGECVASRIVRPSRALSSASSASTRAPLSESRLPVGSSATSSAGRWTTARAMAARCSSPPDSCCGKCDEPVRDADPLGELAPRAAARPSRRRPRAAAAARCSRRASASAAG